MDNVTTLGAPSVTEPANSGSRSPFWRQQVSVKLAVSMSALRPVGAMAGTSKSVIYPMMALMDGAFVAVLPSTHCHSGSLLLYTFWHHNWICLGISMLRNPRIQIYLRFGVRISVQRGGKDYPRHFNNWEEPFEYSIIRQNCGTSDRLENPLFEYPIWPHTTFEALRRAGEDRLVFNSCGDFCGLVTHKGEQNNRFHECMLV
jgi:hypothetical protein